MFKRSASRRDFLTLSGATAAGAVLAACGTAPAPGAASAEDEMPAAEGYTVRIYLSAPLTPTCSAENQRLILERLRLP